MNTSLLDKMNLSGKKGVILGIANEQSIAYGCAKAVHELGAELMVTYDRPKTEPYVAALAESIGNPALLLCDVTNDEQM